MKQSSKAESSNALKNNKALSSPLNVLDNNGDNGESELIELLRGKLNISLSFSDGNSDVAERLLRQFIPFENVWDEQKLINYFISHLDEKAQDCAFSLKTEEYQDFAALKVLFRNEFGKREEENVEAMFYELLRQGPVEGEIIRLMYKVRRYYTHTEEGRKFLISKLLLETTRYLHRDIRRSVSFEEMFQLTKEEEESMNSFLGFKTRSKQPEIANI